MAAAFASGEGGSVGSGGTGGGGSGGRGTDGARARTPTTLPAIDHFADLVSARRYVEAASLLYAGAPATPGGPYSGVVFHGDEERLLFLLRFLRQTSKGGLVPRHGSASDERPPPAVRDKHAFEFLLWLVTGIGGEGKVAKVGF